MNRDRFLSAEKRDGFLVSEKRKKIWAVEIDLIQNFDEICRRHSLKWFAANGTLLGAVRHHGFVPWDDDVDIAMPRRDYDRFLSVAPGELREDHFLHVSEPGGEYFKDYARLRNEKTTALTLRDWEKGKSHGIFIDIFPLENRPDSDRSWRWYKRRLIFVRTMLNMNVYRSQYRSSFYRELAYIFGRSYIKLFGWSSLIQKFEQLKSRYSEAPTKKMFQFAHGSRLMEFPASWFASEIVMEFEYIRVRIPREYDKILRVHYGDYHILPPEDKRGMHHNIFFDPDVPYREYAGKITLEEAKAHMYDQ